MTPKHIPMNDGKTTLILTPASEIKPRRRLDPFDREAVIKLLRQAADHTAQGAASQAISIDLHQLADHLEQED